ncbi:MAG: suppressor of fused domain protein [Planctomycetaceae bacterium]
MLRILRNLFSSAPSPSRIEEREQVYQRFFGVPPAIFHSTDRGFPHIDVYHFEPTEARSFHTLITGGMAEYRQPGDEARAPRRLELMMYLQRREQWAVNSLKVMAEYPARYDTFFDAFHTLPMGATIAENSEISAFLLATPENEGLIGLEFDVEGDSVEYLLAIPITAAEHAFAVDVGSDVLYGRLKETNLLIHADAERRSIVDHPDESGHAS